MDIPLPGKNYARNLPSPRQPAGWSCHAGTIERLGVEYLECCLDLLLPVNTASIYAYGRRFFSFLGFKYGRWFSFFVLSPTLSSRRFYMALDLEAMIF